MRFSCEKDTTEDTSLKLNLLRFTSGVRRLAIRKPLKSLTAPLVADAQAGTPLT